MAVTMDVAMDLIVVSIIDVVVEGEIFFKLCGCRPMWQQDLRSLNRHILNQESWCHIIELLILIQSKRAMLLLLLLEATLI